MVVTTSLTPALSLGRGGNGFSVLGIACGWMGERSCANEKVAEIGSFSPGEKAGMRADVELILADDTAEMEVDGVREDYEMNSAAVKPLDNPPCPRYNGRNVRYEA